MHKIVRIGPSKFRIAIFSLTVALWCLMGEANASDRPEATPKSGTPMTLEKCLAIALENSPDWAMAQWEARAAQERSDQAKGSLLPVLSFEASYDRFGQAQRVLPPHALGESGLFDERAADYGIVGRAPLFRGGKGLNALRAAQLEYVAAAREGARTRDLVVFAVTEAFYQIVGLDSLIATAQFSRQSLEAHHRQVEERIAVGKAAKVDLLRIAVRLADLDQTLVQLENNRSITARLLLYRMGREGRSGNELRVVADLKEPELPYTWEEMPEQALANRADYRAIQLRTEAQRKRLSVAKGGRWPEVVLKGRYGGRSGGDLEFDTDWNVGVQLGVPLFAGGTISAGIKQEDHKLHKAEEVERKLRLTIELEVRAACLHLQEARTRIHTADVVVKQAREVLRIEQERHRLGKGTVADVLEAQAELLKVQTQAVQALVDRALAAAELEKAMGAAGAALTEERRSNE
jgi:outer membrane protein TolC